MVEPESFPALVPGMDSALDEGKIVDRPTRQMLTLGGIALGGFLLWSLTKKASAAQAAAASVPGSAPALSPIGVPPAQGLPSGIYEGAGSGSGALYQSSLPAPTVSQVAAQGNVWSNLQPTAAPGNSGWVNFPSGSQAAMSLLPWRTDGVNWYTQWAGVVYAVPIETDSYGNYTAVAA